MVPSHRPVGSADGPALFPVYGWDFSEWSLEETLGWLLDSRVAAGASPAAKATLYKGNPNGSLSSRVRLRRRRCSLSGIRLGFF